MVRKVLLGAVGAAMMLSPAAAQEPRAAQDNAQETQPAKTRKVCRRTVPTGSNMSRTVCYTKAEWDRITARSREDLGRSQDRHSSSVGSAGSMSRD